ncbi:MAG: diguanylate cyclase [Bacilli bacterium]|nr:diguanylate cyclase [Bacilli bacterium]
MKNKKILIAIILFLIFISGVGGYFYFFKIDSKTTLTASEKNWIEGNKNNLIDLYIPNDVPVLSDNGDGVVFDFLKDLEKDTGLEFNKSTFINSDESKSEYAISFKEEQTNKNILLYQDNYVLVSKNNFKFLSLSDINNVSIGVLEKTNDIEKKLSGIGTVTYKKYKTDDLMFTDLKNNAVDLVLIPRLSSLDKIVAEDYNIAYNITDYTYNYILSLGSENVLNNILKKYYNKWSKERLNEVFDKNLVNSYFSIKEANEQNQVKFRSKRYNYGFIDQAPFDLTVSDGPIGLNHRILSNFAKAANIEFDYKKYSNLDSMTKDFGENKLDLIFDNTDKIKYNMDTFNTVSTYDEKINIIADQNTDFSIGSLNSFSDKKIKTIKNSRIEEYLKENSVPVKTYNNIKSLISSLGKNDLAAVDAYTYDYYIRTDLNNFKTLYSFNLDSDYNFIIRDISANKMFLKLFNYYLSFSDTNKFLNNGYKELISYNKSNRIFKFLIILFSAILFVLLGVIIGKIIKKRKNPYSKFSKADKLRYIDNLTSLKNRDYLNDNIKIWDSSNIYPQGIIIIDLNNIAYINDNFGHTEGDKVIVEAAGVLIKNQLPNSEIIRTNGNEFLIFVLEYDEKKIISYIRKLNKELKNISHGFGAAIGYSLIVDEVKTIDDAINEATLDMRNNKFENNR